MVTTIHPEKCRNPLNLCDVHLQHAIPIWATPSLRQSSETSMVPLTMHFWALKEHLTPQHVPVEREQIGERKISRKDPLDNCHDATKPMVLSIKPKRGMITLHCFNRCDKNGGNQVCVCVCCVLACIASVCVCVLRACMHRESCLLTPLHTLCVCVLCACMTTRGDKT